MADRDPNRFACPEEAALVRHILESSEEERQLLARRTQTAQAEFSKAEAAYLAAQAAYTTANDFLVQSRARQSAVDDEVRRHRGLLHPIRRLPEDVLRLLFSTTVDSTSPLGDYSSALAEANLLAFRLAAVCRRWRATALSLRSIWQFVYLELGCHGRAQKSAEVALALLRLCYNRSGRETTSGLHVCVELGQGVAANERYSAVFNKLRLLLSHHVKSLTIMADNAFKDFYAPNLTSLFSATALVLEELTINSLECTIQWAPTPPHDEQPMFFPHCPNLTAVNLGNLQTTYFATKPDAAPNVRDGHFWVDRPGKMHLGDLLAAASCYPNMQTLKIGAYHIVERSNTSPLTTVTLPKVREVEIALEDGAVHELGRWLELPALEKAQFCNDGRAQHPDAQANIVTLIERSLRHVVDLTLDGVWLDNGTGPAVGGLDYLESLTLVGCYFVDDDAFRGKVGIWTRFRMLKSLIIEEAGTEGEFTGETLLELIRTRTAIEAQPATAFAGRIPRLEKVEVTWDDAWLLSDAFVDDWDERFDAARNRL